jgi:hypothetical protein
MKTCCICRRRRGDDKIDGRRCTNQFACHRYALDHMRAKPLPKSLQQLQERAL